MLGEMGAGVIDSDAVSHREINKREVTDVLLKWWGSEILAADGGVDRQRVGAIVFADDREAVHHPRQLCQTVYDLGKHPIRAFERARLPAR